jgi:hypothetical protein
MLEERKQLRQAVPGGKVRFGGEIDNEDWM